MPLSEEDMRRLESLGHERAAFTVTGPDGWPTLATREPVREGATQRPCFFLHDERCSVYADRPQGCRIYPLVVNEQGRLLRDEDCPHRVEFAMDPAAKRRIQKLIATLQREARAR